MHFGAARTGMSTVGPTESFLGRQPSNLGASPCSLGHNCWAPDVVILASDCVSVWHPTVETWASDVVFGAPGCWLLGCQMWASDCAVFVVRRCCFGQSWAHTCLLERSNVQLWGDVTILYPHFAYTHAYQHKVEESSLEFSVESNQVENQVSSRASVL